MTQSTPKTSKRPLIHHPSDVLDQFCQCDSATWVEFDAQLTESLRQFEDEHRTWFTPKAIVKSLGR